MRRSCIILSWRWRLLSLLLRRLISQNVHQTAELGPVAVAHILANVLTQPCLQSGLPVDDVPKLFERELKKGGVACRRDEFGAPDEPLPERWVRPYTFDDQPVEERRTDEIDHRFVCRDRLNDLSMWRLVRSWAIQTKDGMYRAQEECREIRLFHDLLHDCTQHVRCVHIRHSEAYSDCCASQ